MRHFPSEKTLVTAYWRKLARFNGAGSRGARARLGRDPALRRPARQHYPVTRPSQFHSSR